jgi:competence ComEA-like helix-hairpin-helix protein
LFPGKTLDSKTARFTVGFRCDRFARIRGRFFKYRATWHRRAEPVARAVPARMPSDDPRPGSRNMAGAMEHQDVLPCEDDWRRNAWSRTMLKSKKSAIDEPVDINRASEDELASIDGIGEGRARAIVGWRTRNGRFEAVEDLQHVPEMTTETVRELRDKLKV